MRISRPFSTPRLSRTWSPFRQLQGRGEGEGRRGDLEVVLGVVGAGVLVQGGGVGVEVLGEDASGMGPGLRREMSHNLLDEHPPRTSRAPPASTMTRES